MTGNHDTQLDINVWVTIMPPLLKKTCFLLLVMFNVMLIIISIIVFIIKNDIERQEINPQHMKQNIDSRGIISMKRKKLKVIIYTKFRSGSTFFSSLLSYCPNIYFLFEPLVYVPRQSDFVNISNIDFSKILNCKFPKLVKIGKETFHVDQYGKYEDESVRPFRHWQEAIFCTNRYLGNMTRQKCMFLTTEQHENICHSRSIILVKVIRVKKLKYLYPLMKKDKNTRILFLTRDPRGVISSRISVEEFDLFEQKNIEYNVFDGYRKNNYSTMSKIANELCYQMNQDLKFLKIIQNTPLRGNIQIVRYEDVAQNIEAITKIYNYLGITWDPAFVNYDFKRNSYWGVYGIKRMMPPHKIAIKWMKKLPIDAIMNIQSIQLCREVMAKLRYQRIQNSTKLSGYNIYTQMGRINDEEMI